MLWNEILGLNMIENLTGLDFNTIFQYVLKAFTFLN